MIAVGIGGASASKTSRSPSDSERNCIQRSTSITSIIFTATLPKNSLQISCGRILNPDIKDRRNAVAFNGLCVQLLSSEGPFNKMRCCLHPCFTDEPEIDTTPQIQTNLMYSSIATGHLAVAESFPQPWYCINAHLQATAYQCTD